MGERVRARIRVAVWPDGTWSAVGASDDLVASWNDDMDSAVYAQTFGNDVERYAQSAAWCWVEVELTVPAPPTTEATVVGVTDE